MVSVAATARVELGRDAEVLFNGGGGPARKNLQAREGAFTAQSVVLNSLDWLGGRWCGK